MFGLGHSALAKTTSYKVILPFYAYASASFLLGAIFLLLSSNSFTGHYFHPQILAITHIMALGWGTMMIMGASHQLVPVLIEGSLFSNTLAYISFALAAVGIPHLVYGLYVFDMGLPAQCGGILIVGAILVYLVNLAVSMSRSNTESIHAVFVFTAGMWLLATAALGLSLVYNFTTLFMAKGSIAYLPLHAHLGIIGWFLLMVMGVGSRLIPMFMISKYKNNRLLWWIYALVNLGLLGFLPALLYSDNPKLVLAPLLICLLGIILFARYCYAAYKMRIRKKLDEQMKVSLFSVLMMVLPFGLLLCVIGMLIGGAGEQTALLTSYGFLIFFGWITSIILGMSFKTLPFIVWNKVYSGLAGTGKTPNPKDLFHNGVFKVMSLAYLLGLIVFTAGILLARPAVLLVGAVFLLATAILYNWNIIKIMTHKAQKV